MGDLESMPHEDLIALATGQRETIDGLRAEIEELQAAAARGRWRRRPPTRSAKPSAEEPLYAGLAQRVEKILRLAEEEAQGLREAAQQAAADLVAAAERDAARIRTEARAEARAKAHADAGRIEVDDPLKEYQTGAS